MTIDTFRYFMSALIQVFGALVAVDAIFLLFKHEKAEKAFISYKRNLAVHLFLEGGFSRAKGHLTSNHRPPTINLPQMGSLTQSGLISFLEFVANEKLISLIQESKLNKEEQEEIKNDLNKFNAPIKALSKQICICMGIPVALVVLFSIFLIFTDFLSKYQLIGVSIFSISLASSGLIGIIGWAMKSFKDDFPQKIAD